MAEVSECPVCSDTDIYVSLRRVYCCTFGCQNHCPDQEETSCNKHPNYFILCFCEECIFCKGRQFRLRRFRFENKIYDLYFTQWDIGLGDEDYLVIRWGDDIEHAKWANLEMIEHYPALFHDETEYKPLMHAFEIFKQMIKTEPELLDDFLLKRVEVSD